MTIESLQNPERKNMTEAETKAYLKEHGVQLLTNPQPHQPILYVFEEMTREDNGPFKFLPADKRPSICRLYDPIELDLNKTRDGGEPDRIICDLKNEGGRVDFYAINSETKKPEYISSEYKDKQYQVVRENLFEADDALFPPLA